ncbi:Ig domain-containing protein [Ciceribacter selenitireducens]|uniref:Dystroglycan-type cadherin-like domain-containing protein n=1 Tax=Ciceribacter selenitireducens ATCC BAA-1503 TaxID=1336235 RepID=A0A376AAP8_9HYPH|nr:Ig domain-containing protein [Ciceribacter selenitireducens]SSC64533.1 unnamed protein product [Ciceribacter selenitireducens ATCC BAA-1503]
MLKMISVVAILIASNATAGEIVWRSPTTGTLSATVDPAPTQPEPEQPAFSIHYDPIRVVAGSVVNVMPSGDARGYSFALRQTLPPGLTLDPATGKIAGLAAVAGSYSVTIRATKEGESSDLVMAIIVS